MPDVCDLESKKLIDFFKAAKEKYGDTKSMTWDQLISLVYKTKSMDAIDVPFSEVTY